MISFSFKDNTYKHFTLKLYIYIYIYIYIYVCVCVCVYVCGNRIWHSATIKA